jgi:hypothetical protein
MGMVVIKHMVTHTTVDPQSSFQPVAMVITMNMDTTSVTAIGKDTVTMVEDIALATTVATVTITVMATDMAATETATTSARGAPQLGKSRVPRSAINV